MITSDLLKGTRLFASLAEEELAQLSGVSELDRVRNARGELAPFLHRG
jgi:hypothetical protein